MIGDNRLINTLFEIELLITREGIQTALLLDEGPPLNSGEPFDATYGKFTRQLTTSALRRVIWKSASTPLSPERDRTAL